MTERAQPRALRTEGGSESLSPRTFEALSCVLSLPSASAFTQHDPHDKPLWLFFQDAKHHISRQ